MTSKMILDRTSAGSYNPNFQRKRNKSGINSVCAFLQLKSAADVATRTTMAIKALGSDGGLVAALRLHVLLEQ